MDSEERDGKAVSTAADRRHTAVTGVEGLKTANSPPTFIIKKNFKTSYLYLHREKTFEVTYSKLP